MKASIKSLIRDLIPRKIQVPVKYWYSYFNGMLEPEINFLKLIIPTNGYAIDIGGNRGVYSYKLNLLRLKVETFEPNLHCFKILNAWARNNRNITVHQIALSNSSGAANLHIPVDDSGVEHDSSATIENIEFDNQTNQSVVMETLDHFQFQRVDFIKVDVEGHESTLLDGAEATLKRCKPSILIEIEQRHNDEDISKIFSKITNHGYKGYFLRNNTIYDINEFNIELYQSMSEFGNLGLYINNFFFLNKDRIQNGEYDQFISLIDNRQLSKI